MANLRVMLAIIDMDMDLCLIDIDTASLYALMR
jgi:hypothetical protein